MSMSIDDVTVTIKLLREPKTILAQATLTFYNLIEIHGYTISNTQKIHPKFGEFVWIQPPRQNTYGLWIKLVFIKNKDLWAEIEQKIYDTYCQTIANNPTRSISNAEEVNPDDIPI